MKILVINPGSTSTKLAVYEDLEQVWRESVFHSAKELARFHHINEQYEYRRMHVLDALQRAGRLMPLSGGEAYCVLRREGCIKLMSKSSTICGMLR